MKKVLFALALVLVLSVLSGCAKKTPEEASSSVCPTPTATVTPLPEPTAEPSPEDPFTGTWYMDMTVSGAHTDLYEAFEGLKNYGGELTVSEDGTLHMVLGVDYDATGTYTVISEGQLEAKLTALSGESESALTLNFFVSSPEAHTYLTCELEGHTLYWEK